MEFERYEAKNNISQLDNRPKMSADDLKKEFDKAENSLGVFINDKLIPSIEEGFTKTEEELGKKAKASDVEAEIKQTNENTSQKFAELDNKSIEVVNISGLTIATPGGNGGSSGEGSALSNKTAAEIYEAYSVGKTIIAQIPELRTATVVNNINETCCEFTVMSGTPYLDKVTFVIDDNESEGCRYYRYTLETYIFDSLDGDSSSEALSAKQGRVLKEDLDDHKNNTNNPHQVNPGQIQIDVINEEYPENTVGGLLREHDRVNDAIYQNLDECERTHNKAYEVDAKSDHNSYPSSKAVWDAIKSNLEIEFVTIEDIYSGEMSHTFKQMRDAHNKGKLIVVTANEKIEIEDEFGDVDYETQQIPGTGIATFYRDEYGYDWFDATLSNGLKTYHCIIQQGYGDLWDVSDSVCVSHDSIVDNLDSFKVDKPLSANQGRVLNETKVDKYYKQLFPTLTITENDILAAGDEGITELRIGDDNSNILETINELCIQIYVPKSTNLNSGNKAIRVVLSEKLNSVANIEKAIFASQSASIGATVYDSNTNYIFRTTFSEDKTPIYTDFSRDSYGASGYPAQAAGVAFKSGDSKKCLIGSKAIVIYAFSGSAAGNLSYFKFPKGTTVTVYGR